MAPDEFPGHIYWPHCVVDNSNIELWDKADVSSWPLMSGLIKTCKSWPSRPSPGFTWEKSLGQWRKGLWVSQSLAIILNCCISSQPEPRVPTCGMGQSCSPHSDPWIMLWRAEPRREKLASDHSFNAPLTADKRATLPAETEVTLQKESVSLLFYKINREDKVGNIPSIPTTPSLFWLGIQV